MMMAACLGRHTIKISSWERGQGKNC